MAYSAAVTNPATDAVRNWFHRFGVPAAASMVVITRGAPTLARHPSGPRRAQPGSVRVQSTSMVTTAFFFGQ